MKEFLNHTYSKKENSVYTHECPPFAIINPDDTKTVSNALGVRKIYYGRQYPWGFVDAFNTDYSDFGRLYKLIISIHLFHSNLFIDILWNQLIETTDRLMEGYFIQDNEEKRVRALVKAQTQNIYLGGLIGASIIALGSVATFLKFNRQQK